jgi:hypothetical protein
MKHNTVAFIQVVVLHQISEVVSVSRWWPISYIDVEETSTQLWRFLAEATFIARNKLKAPCYRASSRFVSHPNFV